LPNNKVIETLTCNIIRTVSAIVDSLFERKQEREFQSNFL